MKTPCVDDDLSNLPSPTLCLEPEEPPSLSIIVQFWITDATREGVKRLEAEAALTPEPSFPVSELPAAGCVVEGESGGGTLEVLLLRCVQISWFLILANHREESQSQVNVRVVEEGHSPQISVFLILRDWRI
ncbi:hypothetical protein PIB30_072625 [Stylosanthes scabra]|uniref:Uncharacterized protein n=1 Tax=Stylosanthes scabra TaxID=79078 RepID=A0ABU6ZMT3_9FABA|nr:hypothetical protein [Stylosanthes scabra]